MSYPTAAVLIFGSETTQTSGIISIRDTDDCWRFPRPQITPIRALFMRSCYTSRGQLKLDRRSFRPERMWLAIDGLSAACRMPSTYTKSSSWWTTFEDCRRQFALHLRTSDQNVGKGCIGEGWPSRVAPYRHPAEGGIQQTRIFLELERAIEAGTRRRTSETWDAKSGRAVLAAERDLRPRLSPSLADHQYGRRSTICPTHIRRMILDEIIMTAATASRRYSGDEIENALYLLGW